MFVCVCRKVKDVVTTKESKWKNQLKELRENNPISNSEYLPFLIGGSYAMMAPSFISVLQPEDKV